MGFFDSIKKSLGLAAGELEIRFHPGDARVGGEIRGEVALRALKDLNIFSVRVELIHQYPDEYEGLREESLRSDVLAEQVSMKAGESHAWPLHIEIPPQIAPSIGRFAWRLMAEANIQAGSPIRQSVPVQIKLSPIMYGVVAAIQQQFGFEFRQAGADEDGVWMTFRPTGPIKAHFGELEVAFDEQEEGVMLWVSLEGIRPEVLHSYRDAYDAREGSIEIPLPRRDLVAGEEVNQAQILNLLRPLFKL